MGQPLSREQRRWLTQLGTLVGEQPADEVEEQPEVQVRPKGAGRDADDKALVGGLIPGLPDIKSITTRVTIKNKTNVALRFVPGSASLENLTASFVNSQSPPIDIGPLSEGQFAVTNEPSLSPIPTGGTGGEVKYDVVGEDKKTQLFMKWERGGIAPSRKTVQTLTPDDGRFKLEGVNSGGDDFQFDFTSKSGPPPGPGPGPAPGPTPSANVPSSCLINVVNQTALPLRRAQTGHERGNFMLPPPRTVAPDQTVNFVSVETTTAKEQGCKGFVVWEVGSPVVAVWRIEWDNPEGATNTSSATLTPPNTGLVSQDVIGQGEENVPVSFALSGGPAEPPGPGPAPGPGPGPAPGPGPGPGPEPQPDIPFEPPAKAKQPTLRKGDKSQDGWVEYAQMLLNFHLGTKLVEDGDFGGATLAAVTRFQKEKKLQVDGTIGNQTWAALREGAPEKPSTDGRQPHTFVEKGVEARWVMESQQNNAFLQSQGLLRLAVETVGDTPIDPATEATVRITAPGAKPKVVKVKVGGAKPNKVGFSHEVDLEDFRKRFPSVPVDAPVTDYLVEAFLPPELGGDFYSGKVRVK